jgi:signal transduction histidine kinase/CheY-like chemotaxis protein
MRFGGKQNTDEVRHGGFIWPGQAQRHDQPDPIRGAVRALLAADQVDRAGVWTDEGNVDSHSPQGLALFRGIVAERDGDGTPSEWTRLSLEALPFLSPLAGGRAVQQDLDGTTDQPMLGALLELQRAVWVPVGTRGRLRGVVLAGTRRKHGTLPLVRIEGVAAELALAIEVEEERRLARQRQADLNMTSLLLAELAASGSVDSIFAHLVEGCTDTAPCGDGLGAVFAILKARGDGASAAPHLQQAVTSVASRHQAHCSLAPCWRSGDATWLHAIDNSPVASIWQGAEDARDTIVIASGSGPAWSRADVARIVAIPLLASREPVGILIAGLRPGPAGLGGVGRLELRGEFAATALALRQCTGALSLERKRHHVILQNDPAAKITIETGGQVGILSRGARELLGLDATEMNRAEESCVTSYRTLSELFQAPDQPKVEEWLQRVQSAPRPALGIDEELHDVRLRTGTAVRLRPISLGAGDAPNNSLAAVLLEPLEVDRTSPQPHRCETELHALIEWLEEGVVLFNANHEIEAMNGRFAQIAGLMPDEAPRIKTLSALISRMADQAAEPEKFTKRWLELARGADGGVRDEIQLLRPVPRVVERASRPIIGASGERFGRVEIYRDLTAQRVFQSKLLQTEKLAALGQMVTGVAHELSNPLTSILGYAQRLFLRNDKEGQSEEARQIFQEAERAGTILRQLLVTARESRPERRCVSLNQIVTRTMELQKFNLAAEEITIELDLDSSLPGILGDAGQLQQVLMNLIGNSRQAIEQRGRGGKIHIATHHAAGQVQLEISDDGPGIPPAIASRIFDPFFTTKPAGIGTGLGLAIVLGIVREHGGQVKATNSSGHGATFTLEFSVIDKALARTQSHQTSQSTPIAVSAIGSGVPLRDTGARTTSTQRSQPPAPTDSPLSSYAGARVLVVEDEPTVARLISDVLEDEGLAVEALLDSREALERIAEADYDLVICDMKMPELDGEHFYKRLAASGNPLSRRFLFVTGDVMAAHTQDFLERNQLPHVAKPFRVEELTEKVRRVLTLVKPARPSSNVPATFRR